MNQQFFMLTEEAILKLAEQITANIKNELQPTSNATKDTTEDVYLNIIELSELIGLTRPTIYGHVHRKTIPFIKKGKMLRFSKQDIMNWLQDGKSKSKSDLEAMANEYLAKKPLFNR
jgi:excisionase family DNA binding protein